MAGSQQPGERSVKMVFRCLGSQRNIQISPPKQNELSCVGLKTSQPALDEVSSNLSMRNVKRLSVASRIPNAHFNAMTKPYLTWK